jgi:hypothetical protein
MQGRTECGPSPTSLSPHLHRVNHRRTQLTFAIKRSATVDECQRVQTSRTDEYNGTPPLSACFHIRRHFATLLLHRHLSYGNKTYRLLAGRFNCYCHTTSSRLCRSGPTQYMGSVTFGAPLLLLLTFWGYEDSTVMPGPINPLNA